MQAVYEVGKRIVLISFIASLFLASSFSFSSMFHIVKLLVCFYNILIEFVRLYSFVLYRSLVHLLLTPSIESDRATSPF